MSRINKKQQTRLAQRQQLETYNFKIGSGLNNYANQIYNKSACRPKLTLPSISKLLCFFSSFGSCYLFNDSALKAEIIPDTTVNTQVNQVNQVTEITGGTTANDNLFHSFQDFSLETGNTAFFNQDLNIRNIITRVTGSNISNIDGLIRANGDANLILINPSGINFGSNARIDVGGSFLGSTADSIIFADGTVFSSKDTQINPLLTISVPLGLQLGQNPGKINVSGTGHNLSVADPVFSAITFGESTGMQVNPGKTLALVGGEITLDGGAIAAPGGKIELGSVAAGVVELNFSDPNLSLGYKNITALNKIQLRSQALADVSGTESFAAGSIQVQANQLSLNDGSLLLVHNRANQGAGNINVNVSDSITLSGTNADGTVRSSFTNETLGIGKGGDIQVTTRKLSVDQGATIVAKTLFPGTGIGGNVTINAADSVEVIGSNKINPSVTSSIVAASFGVGDGGNNTITTNVLNTKAGGTVAATAFNLGNGGDIRITAQEINLTGVEPIVFAPSALTASTLGAGDAGNLIIDTASLTLRTGGRVDASTAATGNAGSITINARDFVTVSDTVPGSLNPSLIASSANILDPSLQQLFKLPPIPSGNSGEITINTPQLSVSDGALITTRNDGLGNSGNIQITADSISLSREGSITSAIGRVPDLFSGGGSPDNFNFNNNSRPPSAPNSVQLQGGNINISAENILIEGGSSISTNTFTDIAGGKITINAAGSIKVQGYSAVNPTNLSFISTSSFATGNSGDLDLSTGKLTILNGSRVGAGTFGAGLGGDVNIKATELVEVIGVEPSQSVGSLLGASSLGVGNAGNLTVDTAKLIVKDGGRVDSSAAAQGSAGNVNIQASERIEVSGQIPGTNSPSLISSGANLEDEITRQIFRLPSIPSGNAGNVDLTTRDLKVTDGGEVSVVNDGLGDAGKLQVNAKTILLDNQGSLSAATNSGVGGDITLLADNVFLTGQSTATATAGGGGDGGNISIIGNNLVVLDQSQITANANQGAGGNIEISNRGIYSICEECQITASSRLGVDGVVSIETLQPNTQLQVVDLPQQPRQPQETVAVGCPSTRQADFSELAITGRGGLPPRPQGVLSSESLFDFKASDSTVKRSSTSVVNRNSSLPLPARGWYQNAQGKVILSAKVSITGVNNPAIAPTNCQSIKHSE